MAPEPTRAVVYLRVGTVEQHTNLSQQKQNLLDFAQGRFRIIGWYGDECESGNKGVQRGDV
jgi:DNA invertase Pin-like site-specific DNA recombinase